MITFRQWLSESREPMVGLFWIISTSPRVEIFAHAEGFRNAPRHGDVIHGDDRLHSQVWEKIKQTQVPWAQGKAYDQVPRGKIYYKVSENKFHISVTQPDNRDRGVIAAAVREFNIPRDRYVVDAKMF